MSQVNLTDRERAILNLANDLIGNGEGDKRVVDASFFFQFEKGFTANVVQLRQTYFKRTQPYEELDVEGLKWMIDYSMYNDVYLKEEWTIPGWTVRRIAVRPKNNPNQVDGVDWRVESDKNGDLFFRIEAENIFKISQNRDQDLWLRLHPNYDENIPMSEWGEVDEATQEAIFDEKWRRLKLRHGFFSEIARVGKIYGATPGELLNYILWRRYVPHIQFDKYQFGRQLDGSILIFEYKTPSLDNLRSWLELGAISDQEEYQATLKLIAQLESEKTRGKRGRGKDNLSIRTVIRTWAIFLLSRKGGGHRTLTSDANHKRRKSNLQSAMDLWNEKFKTLAINDSRIFRSQLNQLLGAPPRKSG